MRKALPVGLAVLGLVTVFGAVDAQDGPAAPTESGVIASGPPFDLFVEITTGPNGAPVVSQIEFTLVQGGYYRFNVVCPDAVDDSTGFRFNVTDLLMNSHLRVISVGDIEFYMQGLTFREIQCDEAGTARFSFYPIRTGTYDMYIADHAEPPHEVIGTITVE